MNEDVCDFDLQFLDKAQCSWERVIPTSLGFTEAT